MSGDFQQKVEFGIGPSGAQMHAWVSPVTILTFLMDPESLDKLCAEWAKVREQPPEPAQPESPYMMREEG